MAERSQVANVLWGIFKRILRPFGWVFLGALAVLLLWAYQSQNQPDLRLCHRVRLNSEFRSGDSTRIKTLPDYLALEDRLFKEARVVLEEHVEGRNRYAISRYNAKSPTCPWNYTQDFNRTYEVIPKNPRGAILLLHGLTDSPYSMHELADLFADEGLHVLVLRLPGHGTSPSGLLYSDREDWQAVTRLGAQWAKERAGTGPFYMGGYSVGGALCVQYTLAALQDGSIIKPDRVFLFSPAIGITRLAALGNLFRSISFIPTFEKSKWTDILPEYDPYKYNSFSLKAANESFMLTREIRRQLDRCESKSLLSSMPPVLTFMSVADATILAADTADMLYKRLPPANHELVLFDVNRLDSYADFLTPTVAGLLERIDGTNRVPFRLTLITNRDAATPKVLARHYTPDVPGYTTADLGLEWPARVFSLSHVAVTLPMTDPLYGLTPDPGYAITFGNRDLRGENQVLSVSMAGLLRLRSNPFFSYMETRLRESIRTEKAASL